VPINWGQTGSLFFRPSHWRGLNDLQATTPENHLSSSKIVAAVPAARLQLKALYAVIGSQNPGTAAPQQCTNNQQSQPPLQPQSQSQLKSQSQSQPQPQQNGPDLSKLSPRLQQHFDHVQNVHLGNIVIAKFSATPVAWSCDQCPSGYPHKWIQTPNRRTANDGCPFCSGRRACRHKSLAMRSPAAAASWDFSANEGTPDDYTAGSNHRATWNCQDCGLS